MNVIVTNWYKFQTTVDGSSKMVLLFNVYYHNFRFTGFGLGPIVLYGAANS